MNGERNFFRFMNYLQSNNPYTYMNSYPSNSYNHTLPSFDQMTNMFMTMNQRYNELDREIERIHHRLEDFSYNNNNKNNYNNYSYGKRKRMNERRYNDGNYDNYDNYDNYNYDNYDNYDNYNNYNNYDNYNRGRNYDYDYDDKYRNRYKRHSRHSHSSRNNRNLRNRYNNRNRYDYDDVDSYSKERDYNNYHRRKRQRVHNTSSSYYNNEEEDWDDQSDVEKFLKNKDKSKKKNKVYFQFDNEQDNYKKNKKHKKHKKNKENKKNENNDSTENDSESSNESDSTFNNEEISIRKRSIGDNNTNENKILSKHSNNVDDDNDDDDDDNNYNNRMNRNRRRSKNFINDYSKFQPRFYYSKIKKEPKKKYLIVLDIYNLFYQRISIDSVSSLIKVNPHYKVKNAFIYLRPFVDTFLRELFNIHKKFINNEEDNNGNNNDDEMDNDNVDDKKKEKKLVTGFEVAIWNTSKPRMVKEIVQLILNNVPVDYLGEKKVNYMKKLHFIWTLDQCQSNENMIDDEAPRNLRLVDTIINSKEMNIEKGTIYPPVNEFGHWKKVIKIYIYFLLYI